jgi:adenine-specific DNA-methyltransferase
MKFMGKEVIANDFLTSSYLNAASLVENNGCRLTYDELMFVINHQPDFDAKDGFVYKNFNGLRFSEDECIDLDRIRTNLELLGNPDVTPNLEEDRGVGMYKPRIKAMENAFPDVDDEYRLRMGKAFLMRTLESKILRNCFIGGRYNNGQVIANLDHRINHKKHKGNETIDFVKELLVDYFDPKYDLLSGSYKPCKAYNGDVIELLDNNPEIVADVVYLDPPYGGDSTDYAFLYQFLEEYIYSQKMDQIDHIKKFGKRFVNKKTYEENFVELLKRLDNFPIWMLSYNDSSWADKDTIVDLLSLYRKNVSVHEVDNYMYNYRSEKKKKVGTEYIFIARDE